MVGRSNIIGELVRAGESSCPALLEAAGYRALVWLPVRVLSGSVSLQFLLPRKGSLVGTTNERAGQTFSMSLP
jgi:hypothetical protein